MEEKSASEQISDIIALYGGWKGEVISQVRVAVQAAYPAVVEEVKWKMPSRPEGLPVWSHAGILCRTETFKDNVKLVFSKGAAMDDLQQLFNARQNSSTERAIEFREGDSVDAAVVQKLVLEAVRLNELKMASGK